MNETAVRDAIQRLCPAFAPTGPPQRTETSLLVPGTADGRAVLAKHPTDLRPFWRDRCLHEIAVYRVLADQRPPVTVPRLLAADEARLLLVVERLPGRPIAAARWPQSAIHPADLAAVIATLRTLHSPPVFDYPEQLQRFHRDGLLTRVDHDLPDGAVRRGHRSSGMGTQPRRRPPRKRPCHPRRRPCAAGLRVHRVPRASVRLGAAVGRAPSRPGGPA